MPTFLLQEWLEPQKTLQTPKAHSCCDRPPSSTPSPNPRAGLTSPHQNVRWQNRKAAVCSRHLKVHLHTLSAHCYLCQGSGSGLQRPVLGSAHVWVSITSSFFSFDFFFIFFLDCVCLVAIFKHFLYRTRHNISP